MAAEGCLWFIKPAAPSKSSPSRYCFHRQTAGQKILVRFEREARTAARLNHPGLVPILEAGQADGRTFMAMQLIEGQTLRERLAQGGRLDEESAADIAWQIADALYYAHGQGVVHRDIKPSNILLTEDGRALLTDFGVAQALDDPALTPHRLHRRHPGLYGPRTSRWGSTS